MNRITITESILYAPMEVAFWICLSGVAYAYFGYPLVLVFLNFAKQLCRFQRNAPQVSHEVPRVSVVIPAHNEADVIGSKIDNTFSLDYPIEFQLVVVSDGSTDGTSRVVSSYLDDKRLEFIDLPNRKGKANALNAAVECATGDVIVFSDASIILDKQALSEIVQPFANPQIGCVSGEDRIEGGVEGLYGRYELFLRRQESRLGSIVGASGSFYAQRKGLVTDFPESVAPDFVSVLNTVERRYRAVSAPGAIGYMKALTDSGGEFRRKVRTVIRGITALFQKKSLLNPLRFPMFSFFLVSHKIMRWVVPILLLILLASNMFLLETAGYWVALVAQVSFYLTAALAYFSERVTTKAPLARIALYFTVSNAAILVAWFRYFRGIRQEIWRPSKRGR